MHRILVAESEPELREMLCTYLRDSGYAVAEADNGVAAVEQFHRGNYELLILDEKLTKIDIHGLCELVRRESFVPILLLSRSVPKKGRGGGYELPIDDYALKPIYIGVLLQKIAQMVRAGSTEANGGKLRYKALELDLKEYSALLGGETLDLTTQEFDLLRELIQARGRVLPRRALFVSIWGTQPDFDERALDACARSLMHKLGAGIVKAEGEQGYRVL